MLLNLYYSTLAAVPSRVSRITQAHIRVVFVDTSTVYTSIDTIFET